MTRWLQASKRQLTDDKTDKTDETPVLSQNSGVLSVLSVLSKGPKADLNKAANTPTDADMRHGFTIGGRALTYTGRVVSLEDWRNLSDWEKHGPDGRIWNGKTQEWDMPK